MEIITLDPVLVVKPREKTKRPDPWQVVLRSGEMPVPCGECVLREIFHFTAEKASEFVSKAARDGQAVVYRGSQDAVETKAGQAESCRITRMSRCGFVQFLKFEAQQQPRPQL